MSKEAMKLALGKIKSARDCHFAAIDTLLFEAEEILEEALAEQPAQRKPDYWLGYGLQAHTEKPFEGATPVWTTPQPAQQTCNCRWEGEVQVQQCTLHEAHVDAIHEWAERAKAAEAKLADQPARPYRQLQDNGSKYFGESWDKAEQPAQQALDKMAENERELGIQMQPAQDDPCPGCRKGAVCRTPKCGRLKLPVDHPYRSEQPAQHEPVAWMEMVVANLVRESVNKHKARELAQHFYTSPPAQRTWVGLTLEELSEIYNFTEWDTVDGWGYERAIEAKLKEKNT